MTRSDILLVLKVVEKALTKGFESKVIALGV